MATTRVDSHWSHCSDDQIRSDRIGQWKCWQPIIRKCRCYLQSWLLHHEKWNKALYEYSKLVCSVALNTKFKVINIIIIYTHKEYQVWHSQSTAWDLAQCQDTEHAIRYHRDEPRSDRRVARCDTTWDANRDFRLRWLDLRTGSRS